MVQLAEAGFGMTENAMGDQSNRFAKDEHLFVKFHVSPLQDKKASAKEGRPIFVDREYVSIMVPGDKCSIIDRPASDQDRQRFPRHYAAFKQNEGDLQVGTPLSQWPGVTRSQVEELKFFGVTSVEQLSNLADAQAQQFMGINKLKTQALAYLEAAGENAAATSLAADLEERDNEISALKQAVGDLQDMVSDLKKPKRKAKET